MGELTDLDLDSLDITWFAVDQDGYIAAFFSGGSAQVASYLVKNATRLAELESYFRGRPDIPGNVITLAADVRAQIGYAERQPLPDFRDAEMFARKGLCVFDFYRAGRVWDGYFRLYHCSERLHLADIETRIAEMLRNIRIECSLGDSHRISGAMIR